MKGYAALILAAGKGTRMRSRLCKVLHTVAGRPMLAYVTDAVRSAGLSRIVVVVGHQADEVKRVLQEDEIDFVLQEPQLGTGHAVAAAHDVMEGFSGDVLILCGDVPLIEPATIDAFIRYHELHTSRLTVLTTCPQDPTGYGRIIRSEGGLIARIVEEKDARDEEKAVGEINTGIYLVDSNLLYDLLERITPNNAQREYYLTDIVREAAKESIPVQGYVLEDAAQMVGVNTRAELAYVSSRIWKTRREDLMRSGVTLLEPASVYIDRQVTVGEDTVVHPLVTLSGDTQIGRDCIIESVVTIRDSRIGNNVSILQGSRLDRVVVEDGASIGPMAHLRPETTIGRDARIGNFVEIKKTVVGDGTKAAHLTYLGDSVIGDNVNIGCGTITCNYDGKKKHPTFIGNQCFIGSDVQLVAPVEVGSGSIIGAGSTITRDVPPNSLAVSRTKQRNYPLRHGQEPKITDEDREP
ncbi:MAG: bifunctional UDP-N-acetylglucosamine diphosphorylase/glucosamine-1-phosphate N-acetyltransferase GlmU [Desulfomonilaceae bacterium]|nr:bifunctional UDP-N-acetylglucosamine diphosphorylase/glucosamine-1-phosphate N-acetyltransferase GlmU [Desulfomonilaceae bacterium]